MFTPARYALVLSIALTTCGCGTISDTDLEADLSAQILQHDVSAAERPEPDPALVRLGQALFFDKLLSGNRDISCATCHTPLAATGDGLSLSIGTGGSGLAQSRSAPLSGSGDPILIPRNAPDVFRGALSTMFWDARVADLGDGQFASPAGKELPAGLDSALAVQAMFPVTSRDEMRGQPGENELADIDDDDFAAMWDGLMVRVLAIEEYERLFEQAFSEEEQNEWNFTHAARAIAAFEMDVDAQSTSPFDDYLSGDGRALSRSAMRGATLFFGDAGCARCHAGNEFTDEAMHNRAVPQLGPGKGDGADGTFDFGHEQVTGDERDRFKFRTPPLRNVASTGPWMHDGAYTSLAGAVQHCLDPVGGLDNYDPAQLSDLARPTYHPEHNSAILAAMDPDDFEAVVLTEDEFADLIAFLNSLTAPSLGELSIRVTPESVPSGLPVAD